jgi:two-component system, LytTR family, sensor kinase
MSKKTILYWSLQILGWGAIIGMSLLMEYFQKNSLSVKRWIDAGFFFVLTITVSHLYRTLIIRLNFLGQRITKSIPVVIFGSLVLCIVLLGVDIAKDYVFNTDFKLTSKDIVGGLISYYIFSLLWSVIYFAFHFFDRAREQEVINLQLETSQKDSELSNLKSQLNPHFMFNSMNSIRALIDENPVLAKQAITQLSSLLRSTLLQGNKRLITVEEELTIVTDYLTLEKIRFEERLTYHINVPHQLRKFAVPPLMIQTLVENAIKHGISRLAKGGAVVLEAYLTDNNQCLAVEVWNDGKYMPKNEEVEGIGLNNSTKRLRILFGKQASLKIENVDNRVLTLLKIPLTTQFD